MCSFTQGTRGQRSATLRRASIHSRISVCLCSSAQVTWEQAHCDGHSLLESLCIVVFILVCGFAAVLDPLWKALLQALHSREIFSCTTDTGNERKTFHFSREAIWKRYTHSGMCCCQPYTRERTSHAPQTSGKRKSKNAKGLSHEVPPPTQRPVLKCLGRTVRPYSTVLTLE